MSGPIQLLFRKEITFISLVLEMQPAPDQHIFYSFSLFYIFQISKWFNIGYSPAEVFSCQMSGQYQTRNLLGFSLSPPYVTQQLIISYGLQHQTKVLTVGLLKFEFTTPTQFQLIHNLNLTQLSWI